MERKAFLRLLWATDAKELTNILCKDDHRNLTSVRKKKLIYNNFPEKACKKLYTCQVRTVIVRNVVL